MKPLQAPSIQTCGNNLRRRCHGLSCVASLCWHGLYCIAYPNLRIPVRSCSEKPPSPDSSGPTVDGCEIHFAALFVGIYGGIIIPGILRWCERILSIHSIPSQPLRGPTFQRATPSTRSETRSWSEVEPPATSFRRPGVLGGNDRGPCLSHVGHLKVSAHLMAMGAVSDITHGFPFATVFFEVHQGFPGF